MNKNITHEGVVVGVEGQNVIVQFVQHSACSGCHAKALCSGGSSESAERRVVANSYGESYCVGDKVNVIVASGLAWSAVVIAFVVPLILALVSLFAVVTLSDSEVTGVLSALAILCIYYLVVWTQRNKLERRVDFTIQRRLSV